MDGYGTHRLAAKDAESAIVARICEDFNLTPVLAKAHYDQMARYFSDYGQVPARPGELCYLALSMDEPAGKPISMCRKVEVRLELTTPEDLGDLATKGLAATSQRRVSRLARQARVQGGLLRIEDLSYLLTSSPATISETSRRFEPKASRCRSRVTQLVRCDVAEPSASDSRVPESTAPGLVLEKAALGCREDELVSRSSLEVSGQLLDEEGRNRDRSPPADRLGLLDVAKSVSVSFK